MPARSSLLTNGRIYTRTGEPASALVIEAGEIVWIGQAAAAADFAVEEVIDLRGNWLAPSFVEGHIHLLDTSLGSLNALSAVETVGEFRLRLASATSQSQVLIASGWDADNWLQSPTWDDLPEHLPSYVARVDLHTAVINRRLLQLDPGMVELDGWLGEGLVQRAAHHRARELAIGLLTVGEQIELSLVALRALAAIGITLAHEMAGPVVSSFSATEALMAAIATEPALPEVALWWGELNGFEPAQQLGAVGCGGDLHVDGSLGSRTAWLHEPYADADSCGHQYLDEAQLTRHLRTALELGVPTSFHVIGDAAIDLVLDAISAADGGSGEFARSGHHQLEHALMADATAIERFAQFGLAASVQPSFITHWGGISGMYRQRLGERESKLLPLAGLAQAGVPLVFGSDAPVTDSNPWQQLRAATDHGLTARAAFAAATRSGYRSLHRPMAGVIEVGSPANLALWQVSEFADATSSRWSNDPRSRTQQLPDWRRETPRCLRSWRGGELIFAAGEWS